MLKAGSFYNKLIYTVYNNKNKGENGVSLTVRSQFFCNDATVYIRCRFQS